MNKKAIIVGICAVVVLVAGIGFWKWENEKKTSSMPQEQIQQQSQQEQQNFVVDVDPDVSHWQTKEELNNGGFIIKFPKEWYWMESDFKKTGYHSQVITNNPNFDINKYADIGVFTGEDYLYTSTSEGVESKPLQLNNAEVVITYSVSPTTNAGTPQNSIDSIFRLAKENNPSVICNVLNNKMIPFNAQCSATYESELQQRYYIINDEMSLSITARTTKNTLIKKEIIDKIANSIVLKHSI